MRTTFAPRIQIPDWPGFGISVSRFADRAVDCSIQRLLLFDLPIFQEVISHGFDFLFPYGHRFLRHLEFGTEPFKKNRFFGMAGIMSIIVK